MTARATELDRVAALLKSRSKWRVICHVRPDGDTLGCGSALMSAACLLGKDAEWGGADPLPPLYGFLPHARAYRAGMAVPDDGRCVVAVDVSARDRGVEGARVHVCVDHHADNERFASLENWIAPNAAATGEMVFELISALGCPLTPEIARALYVSIVTDCGWFRFSSTSSNTLRVAAELVKAGAVPSEIDELLDYNDTLSKLNLWGRCLARAETVGERAVLSWVTREDFRLTGARETDTDRLVNMLTRVAGRDVAVLVSELEGALRCSVRSRGSARADLFAARWNGGGHRCAAGCTIALPLGEGLAEIREELRRV